MISLLRNPLRRVSFALLLAVAAACAPSYPELAPRPVGVEVGPAAEATPITPHVVVVSIDGLRPDAIEAAGAHNLLQLMATGAYSLRARTILPSKTLPSHTSMLTGVDVPKHGITWNEDRLDEMGPVQVPTIFDLAHEAGLTTAAAFGKAKFRHLIREGALDWVSVRRGLGVRLAPAVAQDAVQLIAHAEPSLLFVHIADPDIAGHSVGWMTRPYLHAVRRADEGLGHIWRAAWKEFGNDFVLIVTADHGGHGRTHGTEMDVDVLIPWIAWGAPVEPGYIEEQIRTYDTAATALWLLGVPRPEFWDGEPVVSAFEAAALVR